MKSSPTPETSSSYVVSILKISLHFFLIRFCYNKTLILSDFRPLQMARGQTSLGDWHEIVTYVIQILRLRLQKIPVLYLQTFSKFSIRLINESRGLRSWEPILNTTGRTTRHPRPSGCNLFCSPVQSELVRPRS